MDKNVTFFARKIHNAIKKISRKPRYISQYVHWRLWKVIFIAFVASPIFAQEPTLSDNAISALMADEIEKRADGYIIASGNVIFSMGNNHYKTHKISFNPQTGAIHIEEKLYGFDHKGEVVFIADSLTFNSKVKDYSARNINLRASNNLYIAAGKIQRQNDRYIYYDKISSSACTPCIIRPPLWEIQAETAILDKQEQKLFFKNAHFLIRGTKVMTLPYLRLPGPEAIRQDGFLNPNFMRTTQTNEILVLPYFLPLGDHRDLKITPYLPLGFSNNNSALTLHYRQALPHGDISILLRGAKLNNISTAQWAEINGDFTLPYAYQLSFKTQHIKDTTAFEDFLISDDKEQRQNIALTYVDKHNLFAINFAHSQPFNPTSTETIKALGAFSYKKRFYMGRFGKLDTDLALDIYQRPSNILLNKSDILRATHTLDWTNHYNIDNGFIVSPQITAQMQSYEIRQNETYAPHIGRVVYAGALEARYPMIKNTPHAHHILEPIVKISTAHNPTKEVPNSDSLTTTIDEGTFFALSPFTGSDLKEQGEQLNFGLRWSRFGTNGLTTALTLAALSSNEPSAQFNHLSENNTKRSEQLVALRISTPKGLSFNSRALLRSKALGPYYDTKLSYQYSDRLSLSGGYLNLNKNNNTITTENVNLLTANFDYKLQNGFTLGSAFEYDDIKKRFSKTGLTLGYAANCITAALQFERKYSSTHLDRPVNNYQFRITLIGTGTLNETQKKRYCNG